jgi:heme a synthase
MIRCTPSWNAAALRRVSSSTPQFGWRRHFSAAATSCDTTATAASLPYLKGPQFAHNRTVRRWLFCSSVIVFGVVCFGGITRLTESGLSIVEWKPVTGVRPPISQEEWEAEFAKYKYSPEFAQRSDMDLDTFKWIFFWEWAHRFLARTVGVVYGGPLVYFAARGYLRGQPLLLAALVGLLGLGGAQGALGWYMVKSGLDPKLLEEKKKATVSAYRLAAHLTLAFTIYSGMMRIAFGLGNPLMAPFAGKFAVQSLARISTTVMFCTAISGAFVAGLDAGLLYNDGFPLMAGGIFPPADHIWVTEPWWKNFLENPPGAQLWHRLMAGSTTGCILLLNLAAMRYKSTLPPAVKSALRAVNAMLVIQVTLGIGALQSFVAVPQAAAHQAGSLILLTKLIRLCAILGSRGTILM